jgi:LysM repeat protein
MAVKTLNPFVPTIPLVVVPNRSQQERFKRWFFSILGVHLAIVLIVLSKQYHHEMTFGPASPTDVVQSQPETTAAAPAPEPSAAVPVQAAVNTASSAPVAAQLMAKKSLDTAKPVPAHPDNSYTVKSGDTLLKIAHTCGTSVRTLKSLNHLGNERLSVGQKITLPESKPHSDLLAASP